MKEPSGIAWIKESGNLVVANSLGHCLTIHKGYKAPSLQDSIYENNETLSSCGELVNVIHGPTTTFFNPTGICLNSKNQLIVTSEQEVYIFDNEANNFKFIRSFKVNNIYTSSLHGVAVDSFDNILVCDRKNHVVSLFKEDGSFLHSIGREGNKAGFFQSPTGILLDPIDGGIFVVNFFKLFIKLF
eukprot:TRINITY_DN8314_c1_g1_i1.p1 TRINITY_DN8314_c1_g1~~TRINITY_DN8314_c1_g1_i1.p1  ORF type:complete len:186 (-),score=19.59 TRINITY_DN8314_c1_g1_i1:65-622(-)